MAEVNNSLALGVKPVEFDIAKPLEQAAKINSLRASTAQTEQETGYRQFQQDENQGYRVPEVNTLAEAHQKQMDIGGRIGNMLTQDQSLATRKQVIQLSRDAGRQVTPETEQHLLTAPAAQVKQYGQNLRQAGQGAATSMETSGEVTANQGRNLPYAVPPGEPIISRTEAARPTQAKVDKAISTGRNFDGTPRVTSTADVVAPSFGDRFKGEPTNMFTPRVVRGPDGSISSSVTPEMAGLQGAAVGRVKQIQENSGRAQSVMSQLDQIDHENETLNKSGWFSTGSNAQQKLSTAKSINSFFTTMGMPAPLDPNKVAAGESYNKLTFRAGADFARTLGGQPAESVVSGAVSATPNIENTYFGSKVITSSMRQAMQREVDLNAFIPKFLKQNGTTFGAEEAFNKQAPPKLYSQTAIANAIPDTSIKRLTDSGGDEKNRKQFDSTFGAGMADFVLTHARP